MHELINEKQCAELATRWKASIIFPVYPVHDKKDNLKEVLSKPPVEQDICLFFNGGKSLEGNNRLYFCPVTYPPPCESDSKEERKGKFDSINIDLRNAAKACGSPITIGRGGGKARPGAHTYQCGYCHRSGGYCHRSERASSDAKPDTSHQVTYHTNNDKSGRKGVDKSCSRSVNVTNKSIICPFNFTLLSDEHGFFITIYGQAGNAEHLGHPMFDPDTTSVSTRHLNGEDKEDTKYVVDAPGVGTRSSLYPLWNQITNAHNKLEDEGWDKEFEKLLQDHLTKTNAKLRKVDSSTNSADSAKRKIELITTERGSAKRVYNTKRHPF